MDPSAQIKTGAIISYIAIVVNIAIGLVFTPWMINTIGKADYGLYTLAMSIISIFIFDFGLSSAVTRFVAKYLAEENPLMVGKVLGVTYKLYLGIDVLITVFLTGFFFLIPFLYQGLTSQEIEKFKVVFVIAASFSIVSFPFIPLNGVFSAYEKFIQLKLCDLAHKLLTVGLMTWCLMRGFGLYALVIVNAVSGISVVLLKVWLITKEVDVKIDWRFWDPILFKSIVLFSFWVSIIALCQRLIFNLAPSILGVVSDSQNIANLGVAATLEGYVYTFAAAISGLFLPKVSRMVKDDNLDGINGLMVRVGRIQLFVISMIILGFVAVGQDFLLLWVGPDYSDVYLCAILLMIPSFLYLPMEVGNVAVIARNEVKAQSRVFILMALINLVLAFPLSKVLGVLGMCISILIAYLWRTIGMIIVFVKRLSLDMVFFYKESFIKMLPALLIMSTISITMRILHPIPNFWGFLVWSGLFVCLFVLVFFVMGLNQEEKELIVSPFKRLMRIR